MSDHVPGSVGEAFANLAAGIERLGRPTHRPVHQNQQQKGTTMSEKYIDLADTIIEEEDFDYGFMVKATLSALDKFAANYPDQVPGRTITETGLIKSVGNPAHDDFAAGFFAGFRHGGGRIVPDPEPTNAQSISKLLAEFAELNASCGGEQGDHNLAEFLDARGVKAGNDD